ncbi:transglutaminase domain-containing protein, partial [Candidatus Woesearchaeota archaeon]
MRAKITKKSLAVALAMITLLVATTSLAQPVSWFDAQKVITELNISSTISIIPKGPNPYVESITADLLLVPKNLQNTAVRSLRANPPAIVTHNRARYKWTNPKDTQLNFGYSSVVEKINDAPRVRAKIQYPTKFPKELEKYTKPTQYIDSNNPKIIAQAHYLAQNQDDLFLLVSSIGMWVKTNIEYNLSTLTAEVTQPASWALENKYGVCDELTSLFIAMLRALGIPARFVVGTAYTTSPLFPQGWAAHGWAEVYFPGTGWVPFDPTFGEFGWVDPGHIKLAESLDPREPTTIYEWKARDADIKVEDLDITTNILKAEGEALFELDMKAYPLRERVGFGSANGIIVEAENLADYYTAYEVYLAPVTDFSIIGAKSKLLAIPPHQKSKVSFEVKVKEELNPQYQ